MGVLNSGKILTFGGQYKSGSGRLSGGHHPRGQLGGVNAMTPPVVGASNKNHGENQSAQLDDLKCFRKKYKLITICSA